VSGVVPVSRAARDAAIDAFVAAHGWNPAARRPLSGDASFRRYDRLIEGGRRAVLMDAPPPQENVRPFIKVARLLAGMGLSAPRIMAADEAAGLLLLEDLGDDTYTRLLAKGADERMLYMLAVDAVIELHRRLPDAARAELPRFDEARALREVSLLLDWYWPAMFGAPAPDDLRAAYVDAWQQVLPGVLSPTARVPHSMALFDYHVDNLLWLPERAGAAACGLLDFQDAVIAPITFDLVSLLEDVRRDVPAEIAAAGIARYLAAFPGLDGDAFAAAYSVIGAQRNCRIAGTFTRLWKRDGKPGYLKFMPRVWRLIAGDIAHPALAPVAQWFATHLPPEKRGTPDPATSESSGPTPGAAA
jgi:aminoglycoside/choline kinase family phosphotransferase